MVTKYACNHCGTLMTYEDDKYCVMNLGVGRDDIGFEGNKVADICPSCWNGEVFSFIEENVSPRTKIHFDDVNTAIDYLKGQGYITYKQPANWGHKNKRKEKK